MDEARRPPHADLAEAMRHRLSFQPQHTNDSLPTRVRLLCIHVWTTPGTEPTGGPPPARERSPACTGQAEGLIEKATLPNTAGANSSRNAGRPSSTGRPPGTVPRRPGRLIRPPMIENRFRSAHTVGQSAALRGRGPKFAEPRKSFGCA